MSDESIFSQDPAIEVEVESPVQQSTIPQELADLVGEGKKYRSVEDALRSIPHAQSHISKLEEEMKAVRDELQRRKTAEELLDEFKSSGFSEPQAQQAPSTVDLADLVDKTIEQREVKKRQAQNVDSVIKAFNDKFGEQAPAMYAQIAKDNGLSVQFLNSVAASSPVAVLKLAGISEQKVVTPSKTTGSVNTDSFIQNNPTSTLSARLPKAATTKDLVSAWRNAGQMVKQELNLN